MSMEDVNAPGEPPHPGMKWIPGGSYQMGSERHYPEEKPAGPVSVDGFWMDETTVTNAQYAEFVAATGYVTTAEKSPDPAMYPGADPAMLVPGSIVFKQQRAPVDMSNPMLWWAWVPGASWKHPLGPNSTVEKKMDHPVTQVSYEDADAYARWAGKRLPTEAEWERAGRGGIEDADYAWGDELSPGGEEAMNRWVGDFPWKFRPTKKSARKPGTVPVRTYDANPFGLYEITGNTWEWTESWFIDHHDEPSKPCCAPENPRGPSVDDSRDPASGIPRKVLKGGSFLCAENYCSRYRPSSRIPESIESATCHISFRCIARP